MEFNLFIALTVLIIKFCHGHCVCMAFSTILFYCGSSSLVFFKRLSSLSFSLSISAANDQTFEVSSLHCTGSRGKLSNIFMKYLSIFPLHAIYSRLIFRWLYWLGKSPKWTNRSVHCTCQSIPRWQNNRLTLVNSGVFITRKEVSYKGIKTNKMASTLYCRY